MRRDLMFIWHESVQGFLREWDPKLTLDIADHKRMVIDYRRLNYMKRGSCHIVSQSCVDRSGRALRCSNQFTSSVTCHLICRKMWWASKPVLGFEILCLVNYERISIGFDARWSGQLPVTILPVTSTSSNVKIVVSDKRKFGFLASRISDYASTNRQCAILAISLQFFQTNIGKSSKIHNTTILWADSSLAPTM
jgi:hypothetical protein